MKTIVKKVLSLTCIIGCVIAFVSCSNSDDPTKTEPEEHVYVPEDDFVTTWKTNAPLAEYYSKDYVTDDNSITIPTYAGYGPYNYDVDWNNDGVFDETGITGTVKHRYDEPGIYTVRIRGEFPAIYFDNYLLEPGHFTPSTDNHKLVSVDQWGSQTWKYLRFLMCFNFNITATDVPDLSKVTSLNGTFQECDVFNSDISAWDVSNVTSMNMTFFQAKAFNQNIGKWNVANVISMGDMFRHAESFNQNIGAWDVSKVYYMALMFANAKIFNQDISKWNVSNVRFMSSMFSNTEAFNQDITSWDVSNVEDMKYMFSYAKAFNQNIGKWNVGKVTKMNAMFSSTNAFNQDIGAWNVSNVEDMNLMFYNAKAFDQNIGAWNVSKVTNMQDMFKAATPFSQENYDKLLIGWSQRTLQSNVKFNTVAKYCSADAVTARQKLIDTFSWKITDGGRNSVCN